MPQIILDGQEYETSYSYSDSPATVGELLAELSTALAGSQKMIREVSIDGISLTEASLLEASQRRTEAVEEVVVKTMTYQDLVRLGLAGADRPLADVIHAAKQSVESFRFHPPQYEGAITCLREAERRLRGGDTVQARQFQERAFAIIAELMNALNHQVGGEIAANLHRLYAFMLRHLSEGNARKNPQHFDDVAWLLTILHHGVSQAIALAAGPVVPAPREVAVGAL